jgi:uncharacterized protein YoxC
MPETIIIALSIILALAVGFLIHTLIEVRKAATELREFLSTKGESLDATLKEADTTFKSARAITDSINEMAYDAKNISHRLSDTAKSIGSVAHAVGGASTKTKLSTIALGAGIKAAFDVLSSRMVQKKEGGNNE